VRPLERRRPAAAHRRRQLTPSQETA
jgi:hypothetical protein